MVKGLGWSFLKFCFSLSGQMVSESLLYFSMRCFSGIFRAVFSNLNIESLLYFSMICFMGIFRALFSKLNVKEVNRCSFDKMVSG